MVIVVPLPRTLLRPDGSSGLVSEAVHLGQAKARAFTDRLCGEERIEHFRGDVVRNSHTGIFYGYCDLSLFRNVFRADDHRTAFGHRIPCVDDEVHERCLKLVGIDDNVPDTVRDIDRQ
jgi:hypothetical protein